MAKLQRNHKQVLSTSIEPIENESWTNSPSNDKLLTFNILGKLYFVKESLFQKNPNLFYGTVFSDRELLDKYYQVDRQQFIIDISPIVFECILKYYTTEKLHEPTNIHLNYFKEICHQFRIDTSSLELNERYERYVPRQSSVQLIHVILEYPDSCRMAQILHYVCSFMTFLSCFLLSYLLNVQEDESPNHRYFTEIIAADPERELDVLPTERKRSSWIFILDILCLTWAIVETILRTLSTPSLTNYFISLGFFDITDHFEVSYVILFIFLWSLLQQNHRKDHLILCNDRRIKSKDYIRCLIFDRRLMIVTLFRKFRLVRYIRPVKHFVLSLLSSKKEVTRLVVLILFLICVFGPLMLILDSSTLPDCSRERSIPYSLRCIRTLTDATYYLLLIISTVGYGEIYPMSSLARFVSMLVSPFSIMMLSVPLSGIYSKYSSICENYRAQIIVPEHIHYLIYDRVGTMGKHALYQRHAIIDVTKRINRALKHFGINRRVQDDSE